MATTKLEKKNSIGPQITVIGVGGAGNNAVNNMVRYQIKGVDYLVCNTDAQHLSQSLVSEDMRIKLGFDLTQGLGAGSSPEVGREAAKESIDEIMRYVKGSNMIFLTAGMGGGTGTGAAPIIAQAAREAGILTVGVVTKPFNFEGPHRTRIAEEGIKELEQHVDTLITIPNQNLFRIVSAQTTFSEAFKMADDVLYSGVRGVTDLIMMPGLVNLDFADIKSVMSQMGNAVMGNGEASGDARATEAAELAIANPLLDEVSMRGAKGVLINITGGPDMTLFEVDEAANRIREEVESDNSLETNIIFGSTFDENMEGKMRVSIVATGILSDKNSKKKKDILIDKRSNNLSSGNSENAAGIVSTIAQSDIPYNTSENIHAFANDVSDTTQLKNEPKSIKPKRNILSRFLNIIYSEKPTPVNDTSEKIVSIDNSIETNEEIFLPKEADAISDIPAYLRKKINK